jgi:crotonobetainyl-CoA:carnitine CoA-transferase CaiB-like acyl-CoA transferase
LIPLQYAQGDAGRRVLSEVRAIIKTRTHDEWLASFGDDDVCLTTVGESPSIPAAPGPALGADTDRILDSAGLDRARRAALRAAGVI